MSNTKVNLAPVQSLSRVGASTTSMVTVKLKALGVKIDEPTAYEKRKRRDAGRRGQGGSTGTQDGSSSEGGSGSEEVRLAHAFQDLLAKSQAARQAKEGGGGGGGGQGSGGGGTQGGGKRGTRLYEADGKSEVNPSSFRVDYNAKGDTLTATRSTAAEDAHAADAERREKAAAEEREKAQLTPAEMKLRELLEEHERTKEPESKPRPSAWSLSTSRFTNAMGRDTGVFAVSTERWDTPPVGYYNPKYDAISQSKRTPVTQIRPDVRTQPRERPLTAGEIRARAIVERERTHRPQTSRERARERLRSRQGRSGTSGAMRGAGESEMGPPLVMMINEEGEEVVDEEATAEAQAAWAEEMAELEEKEAKERKRNESFFFKTTPRNFSNVVRRDGADTFYYPRDEKPRAHTPSYDFGKLTPREHGSSSRQQGKAGPSFYDTKRAMDATRPRSVASCMVPVFDKQIARDKQVVSMAAATYVPTSLEYDVTDEAYRRLSNSRRTPVFVGSFDKQISREQRAKVSTFGRQDIKPVVPKVPYDVRTADPVVSKRQPVVKFSDPPQRRMFYRPKSSRAVLLGGNNKENGSGGGGGGGGGGGEIDPTGTFVDSRGNVHAKQDTPRASSARPSSAPNFERMTGHNDHYVNLKVHGVDLMYDPQPLKKHTPTVKLDNGPPRFRNTGIRGEPILATYNDNAGNEASSSSSSSSSGQPPRPASTGPFSKRGTVRSRRNSASARARAQRRATTAGTKRSTGEPFDKMLSREQRLRAQQDKPVRSNMFMINAEVPPPKAYVVDFGKSLPRETRERNSIPLKVLSPRQDTFRVLDGK